MNLKKPKRPTFWNGGSRAKRRIRSEKVAVKSQTKQNKIKLQLNSKVGVRTQLSNITAT